MTARHDEVRGHVAALRWHYAEDADALAARLVELSVGLTPATEHAGRYPTRSGCEGLAIRLRAVADIAARLAHASGVHG